MASNSPQHANATRRRRGLGRLATVVLVLVAAGAAAAIWYLSRSAPSEVDLGAAAEAARDRTDGTGTSSEGSGSGTESSGSTGEGDGTSENPGDSADGTWQVDTSVGTFSVADTSGTFVGFRIAEELTGIGATTAIGRTPDVEGSFTIDGATLSDATFEANLHTIVSNDSRRDPRIREALGTSSNPTATFVLTEPVDLGEPPVQGEPISIDATGELTVAGVTHEVTVPLEAVWEGDVVVVTGSFDVELPDYGLRAPSAAIVLSVADTATIELQLYLTR